MTLYNCYKLIRPMINLQGLISKPFPCIDKNLYLNFPKKKIFWMAVQYLKPGLPTHSNRPSTLVKISKQLLSLLKFFLFINNEISHLTFFQNY